MLGKITSLFSFYCLIILNSLVSEHLALRNSASFKGNFIYGITDGTNPSLRVIFDLVSKSSLIEMH